MYIRQEQPSDYGTVYSVIKKAFDSSGYSDGNEQDLVVELRKSASFIPELSLVAVEDEKIVGHILFTKAYINKHQVLALAPLAVLPEYQNRGIGKALIAVILIQCLQCQSVVPLAWIQQRRVSF